MSRQPPSFSIIIPALNEEKYLPLLLRDLAKQSFQDFEVILVDGLSDDQTVAKAKTFTQKLDLTILTSPRRHVCTQRNLGAKSAKAETLIFMDADNRLPSYFLQGVKYRLEQDPADLATCHLLSDSNKTIDKNYALAVNYAVELLKNLPNQARVMEALVIISKSAFEKIGGFDESVDFAEGNNLLSSAYRQQLTFRIYKDPTYIYSFRRFRRFGLLSVFTKGALVELMNQINHPKTKTSAKILYPMTGGKQFDQKRKLAFSHKLSKLLDSIKK